MQKNQFALLSATAIMLLTTSCSKLGPLSADYFSVVPNPLETEAGQVPATINGMFPEKYMKKKAVVTVVPELRYTKNGREVRQQGATATFQGEKAFGNDQTISYLVGGRYTMKTNFRYDDVKTADMFLTFNARIGGKVQKIPDVKVAYGILATSELYKKTLKSAQAAIAPDAFKRINEQKQEASIKFLIQQANLRKSELKNNSVQEFVKMLEQINRNQEGLRLNNVEVSAYASPDGGFSLNDKLAAQREKVTEQYVQQQLKKTMNVGAPIDAKYTAQDWEGFQELVKASNIQDKDVIIRVLSMYKDPEEREQQIKNISTAFRELADGVLPELRRARLTINYETIGRSDEQILEQLAADPAKLSIEEILYGANLKTTPDEMKQVYKTAAQVYPNDYRAYNNLAVVEYKQGNYEAAKQYLLKANNVPEAQANLGLLALKDGDVATAEQYIARATDANGLAEIMGNLNLAKGNYAQAEQDFAEVYSNSAVLAQILNHDYVSAAVTLKYIQNPDAIAEYLKALMSARMGNNDDAAEALKEALKKDPALAKYAANDIELQKIAK
jgi:Tfp pilus assembly protein PilF